MPVIHVDILEGRTIAQKRAYIKALTEVSVKHLGCRPENVAVVLADMPFEHYGRGGFTKLEELEQEGITVAEYHAREVKKVADSQK